MTRRWRAALAARWRALLASPGGPERVARGLVAGAFAAMIPAFGLHLAIAGLAALALRGSLPAAAGACLLFGNPLTHLVIVPVSIGLGRELLPPLHWALPPWVPDAAAAALPLAEDALAGGLLLGLAAGMATFVLARRRLRPVDPIGG